MEDEGINWWRTPPESPDLNPIENTWHELKEFIRRVVKPQTKEKLIVVPKVVVLNGEATGY